MHISWDILYFQDDNVTYAVLDLSQSTKNDKIHGRQSSIHYAVINPVISQSEGDDVYVITEVSKNENGNPDLNVRSHSVGW